MKRSLFSSGILSVFCCLPFFCEAQSPVVNITGVACVNSTLTLNSSVQPYKILWTQNNSPIDSTFTIWLTSASTAAGQMNGAGGSAANQLNSPRGIFTDNLGNVYVGDGANNRVQKWAPAANSGSTVAGGNGVGAGATQLNYPGGIFVDNNGNIYIVDQGNNRIQKWAAGATSGITVAGSSLGVQGNTASLLNHPTGVYVDANANVYVADENNHRVQKWAAGATSGSTVAGGNGSGPALNQLDYPLAVFVDGSGNIYVGDSVNNRVVKWAPNATSGIVVAGGNGMGTAANHVDVAIGVYVDGIGNVFVADALNERIQIWKPGSTSGITIAGGNGVGTNNNQFHYPTGLFVDKIGNLFVCDDGNNRVQLFSSTIVDTFVPPLQGTYAATATLFNGLTGASLAYPVSDTFSPSISVLPPVPSSTICIGDSLTFSASVINGGASPSYQWYRNGLPIPGATSLHFTSHIFFNNDSIVCVLTPSIACPVHAHDTSALTVVTVYPHVTPMVTLNLNTSDTICANQTVTFSAFGTFGGPSPSYTWKLNNVNVPISPDSSTYTTDSLKSADVIQCIFTTSAPCALINNIPSGSVKMVVDSVYTPLVSISIFPSDSLCVNESATFTATVVNGGTSPMIQWFDNSNLIAGAVSDTFSNMAGMDSGHIFICFVTSNLNCVTIPIVQSNPIEIFSKGISSFTVSITASTTHLTQLGQPVTFTANAGNGGGGAITYQWRKNSIDIPGATSATYVDNALVNNDQVDCIMHTSSACVNVQTLVSNLIVISAPLGVANVPGLFSNLKVFPNPGRGQFTVAGILIPGGQDQQVNLEIADMVGNVVFSGIAEVTNGILNSTIELENKIPAGNYILRIKSSGGYDIARLDIIR